ncbi:glycosyltransferase family 9 protein [Thermoproteota archaeon]
MAREKEVKDIIFVTPTNKGSESQPLLPFRRILISRTDRLGDVLLSTPVIKNLRRHMPSAYIAMLVQSQLEDLLRDNPYLDEVILLDKRGKHKNPINLIKFILELKNKKFDLALILHPTLRMHVICFLAGIKERMGYDRKFGFLNTKVLNHQKQLGDRHESLYALDFLKELGLSDFDQSMHMSTYQESESWAHNLIKDHKAKGRKIIAVHSQASCRSKIWPKEYFNQLIEEILSSYRAVIIHVGSKADDTISKREETVNLTGKTSLAQLASVLKQSDLFISNDSGPVHMAVAVGVPVISIFGRKQPGLGPKRWGPIGDANVYLHKDVGCQVCLAHDCNKSFDCLRSINPKEVMECVDKFLSGNI